MGAAPVCSPKLTPPAAKDNAPASQRATDRRVK